MALAGPSGSGAITGVQVELVDRDLYRGVKEVLWLPGFNRGVFGGQVASQALHAAMQTVSSEYTAHSMHCYFILPAKVQVCDLVLLFCAC